MNTLNYVIVLLTLGISGHLFGQKGNLQNVEFKIVTEIEYTWDNSTNDWLKSAIMQYDYSSTGDLSRILKTQAGTNDPLLKIDYYYTSSSALLAYEIYEWTAEEWIGSTNYSYDYLDNKQVKQLIQTWFDGGWINTSLDSVFAYDANDLLVQSTNFRWKNNKWLEDHIIYYEYDENMKLIRKYSVSMSEVNLSQVFYSYTPDGQYDEMYAQFYRNGQWENSWRREYHYDNCGNLLSIIRQSWISGEWINSSKSVYTKKLIPDGIHNGKVTICHKGHTITVSINALEAHLKHGDCIGECVNEIHPDFSVVSPKCDKADENPFEIYPNPARYNFIVKAYDPLYTIKRVDLIDMHGNIVRSVSGNNSPEVQIERNNLKNGKYFVKITGDEIVTLVVILN
jgi:hypothetical protein